MLIRHWFTETPFPLLGARKAFRMKKTIATSKLVAAFKAEIVKFVAFMRRAIPNTPVEEIKQSQFDDPYWESLISWQGRLLGQERMLQAIGITADDLVQAKTAAGLPPNFRTFRAHDNA
jgi:hypothetical protein